MQMTDRVGGGRRQEEGRNGASEAPSASVNSALPPERRLHPSLSQSPLPALKLLISNRRYGLPDVGVDTGYSLMQIRSVKVRNAPNPRSR